MSGPRGWGWIGAAVLVAVGLTGCASATAAPEPGSAVPPPASTASTAPPTAHPTPSPSAEHRRGPAPLPPAPAVDVSSVTIPAIDVHATKLEALALRDDGALAAPKDPDRAGWYAGGSVPGDVGPAVIAGHVDSTTGPAVFYDLRRLEPGDKITVGLSTGKKVTFAVDDVITTAKNGFPTDRVFGPVPDAQLRLITCGGPYDRTAGGYQDNTVVFATAV